MTITGSQEAVDRAIRAVKNIVDGEKRSPEQRKVMQVSGAFVGCFAASSVLMQWGMV